MRPVVTAVLLAGLSAACAGDSVVPAPSLPETAAPTTAAPSTSAPAATAPSPSTTATTAAAHLPPHTLQGLAPILDPLVEPLGFRITRGSLISLTTYNPTPDGTHLALYVVPLEDAGPDQYAERIVPLAAALLPFVFEAWPGLESFDVCQEPFGWEAPGTPPSLTILDLDRYPAEQIDWTTVDLPGLIRASSDSSAITLTASEEIRDGAVWQAAEESART